MACSIWCFNPLPPPKRGETLADLLEKRGVVMFQSTPPAEARGDFTDKTGISHNRGFNPLPPPKRGETATCSLRRHQMGFNPLPPPKRGETIAIPAAAQPQPGFNPLPPPKRGETLGHIGAANPGVVSIHSPRRSEGRLAERRDPASEGKLFQSTPPAEARGDNTM